jgi:RNA polymerase sigma-70 factor, ECF subfamily
MAQASSVVPARSGVGDAQLGSHRRELVGYCYRMLGSLFDAEDAVQETFTRAWRQRARFDLARGSLRTWLFAIATNVCLDALRRRQRRARTIDLVPAATPGDDLGEPVPDRCLEPFPDAVLEHQGCDPADLTAMRESVRLAFVAALQHLPPRQRATLILREVLGFAASEVADLLETTPPAVNSALQRARTTLASVRTEPTAARQPDDPAQRDLLARYVQAFERFDVEELVALLHEDATLSMPPLTWWLDGRAAIEAVWRAAPGVCAGSRLLPAEASGAPAFGQYMPRQPGGPPQPHAVVVLDVRDGLITGVTNFLDAERLFPRFGLPLRWEAT